MTDPTKLQSIRDREEDIMKERIEHILKASARPASERDRFDEHGRDKERERWVG